MGLDMHTSCRSTQAPSQKPTEGRRHTIASHVGPRAFAPATLAGLDALGYRLVAASVLNTLPSLHLVDERHWDSRPAASADPDTPIVSLSGPSARAPSDPRWVGAVRRPAGLADLYAIFQRVLEPHPRRAPRAHTRLEARWLRGDRRGSAELRWISETGCTIVCRDAPEPGAELALEIPLPGQPSVHARARCRRQQGSVAALAFSSLCEEDAESIRRFVNARLAASAAA